MDRAPFTGKRRTVLRAALAWYRRYKRDLPWRQTRDPYAILVSEVMLQQTQVERVLGKYRAWMDRFPTLEALAQGSRAEVIRLWSGLGYNLRAVRLHEIARQAVERNAGAQAALPATLDELCAMKGIGRYTAAAVLCFAHRLPVAVLDTNVRRVLGRIYGDEAPAALEDERVAWQLAEAALPAAGDVYDWNQALMDIGATICLARTPRCPLCPAAADCSARQTWAASDEQGLEVAERAARYVSRRPKQGKFEGSRRWFRGRMVEVLRAAPGGVPVVELAALVELDGGAADEIVLGLMRDGLVEEQDGVVRLPA